MSGTATALTSKPQAALLGPPVFGAVTALVAFAGLVGHWIASDETRPGAAVAAVFAYVFYATAIGLSGALVGGVASASQLAVSYMPGLRRRAAFMLVVTPVGVLVSLLVCVASVVAFNELVGIPNFDEALIGGRPATRSVPIGGVVPWVLSAAIPSSAIVAFLLLRGRGRAPGAAPPAGIS